MKIILNGKNYEVEDNSTVFDVLGAAKINSETVLVKRESRLIPHDMKLGDGDSIETITVISGG
ncbi:MAG: ThiamineS [archaeon GW2011_AR5]|nr:MAG: ThiamineS [archaeon GW2011_AR5]